MSTTDSLSLIEQTVATLLAPRQTTAMFITSDHYLNCTLVNRGQRLLEVINDAQSAYLPVSEVRVYRRNGGDLVETLPGALLPKENLLLALPTDSQHEAKAKRSYAFVEKEQRAIYLLAGGYEIRGTYHARGYGDPLQIMAFEGGRFLPVSDAVLAPHPAGGVGLDAPVVLVNKCVMSLLKVS